MSTVSMSSAELLKAFQLPKKDSFEAIFDHLGTPEEVAAEWTALLALRDAVLTWHLDPTRYTHVAALHEVSSQWLKKNS